MHFEDLDILMRQYEEVHDIKVLPHIYMVARLDGKGFSKLTKDSNFNKPFDIKFNECMLNTTKYLIRESGFNIIYAYTQSDEISLLFDLEENTFNRKLRKFNSVLSGLASAAFTKEINTVGSFDCRISELPNKELLQDYFSWRQADCLRNCLNAYTFWTYVNQGNSKSKATSFMYELSNTKKKEYLLSQGINFNDVDSKWKHGVGMYFQTISKTGFNPKLNESTLVFRNQLQIDYNLPAGNNYRLFIQDLL